MQKDNLLEIKNKIEQYCKENSIAVFYGDVDAPHMPSVEWAGPDLNNWQDYLTVLKQLNGRVLCVETTLNSLEEDGAIRDYYKSLEGEDKRLYKKALDRVTKAKGHLATISLCYFQGGVRYLFELEAEWRAEHNQVLEAYEHGVSEDDDSDDENEDDISEQRANEIARMIIVEESYIKAKARDHSEVARAILSEKKRELNLSDHDVNYVAWRAKKLFEKEVQPKLDKEIEKKVKELKLKGLSKTAVKGQLGITENTIGKYWYL